jgi:DnaK suppressor protein
MHTSDKENIKKHLLKERAKLLIRVEDLKELTAPIEPDCSIGRVSRMDAINNKSVNEAALRQAESILRNIDISLENIDDPDFGKCRRCGIEIPLGRLMVMPGSPLCVGCARN